MSSTDDRHRTTWTGILAGVAVLAAMIGLAVLLPKAQGDEGTGGAALVLPDTLPGGYAAADLESTFGGEYADQAEAISEQQAGYREHAEEVLADVLDVPAATRTYASDDLSTAVQVQAVRAPGGAFVPESISDPDQAAPGQGTQELVREGDAVCIVQRAATSAESTPDATGAPSYASCQRSEGDLTVQGSAAGLELADLVAVLDDVWAEIA